MQAFSRPWIFAGRSPSFYSTGFRVQRSLIGISGNVLLAETARSSFSYYFMVQELMVIHEVLAGCVKLILHDRY